METALILLGLSVAILILILVLRANPWPARYTICGALLIWHFARPGLMPTVWPPFYWAWPIHAQVIDAQTLKPLEGVRVTATWKLTGGLHPHTEKVAELETFTDSEGRFLLWWLRPRLRWPLNSFMDAEPSLRLYKRGYGVNWEGKGPSWALNSIILWSDWHGKIIPLKKQVAKEDEAAW